MMKYMIGLLRYNMMYSPEYLCNNYTTVFSCVPGPRKQWVMQGLKVLENYYIVPGVGGLGCGIGVVTSGDFCQTTVGCDVNYFPNDTHKVFIKKFEEIFAKAVDFI